MLPTRTREKMSQVEKDFYAFVRSWPGAEVVFVAPHAVSKETHDNAVKSAIAVIEGLLPDHLADMVTYGTYLHDKNRQGLPQMHSHVFFVGKIDDCSFLQAYYLHELESAVSKT